MKHKRIISLVLTVAMMLSMCLTGFAVDTGKTDAPPTPVTCTCETKCVEGSVNHECPVCGVDGANLEACKGPEVTPLVPECTCEIKCTEGAVNADCPVCSAKGADLTACTGSEEEQEECTCETKCIEGEVDVECPVCAVDFSQCEVPMTANTTPGITTFAENIVTYIDANGENQTLDLNDTTKVTVFENNNQPKGWALGSKPWYVISGHCTTSTAFGYAVARDEVNILLLDGSTLEIGTFGPYDERANVTLNIYAQSKDDNAGKMILNWGIRGENNFTVNIYGGNISTNCIEAANIKIAGGKITNNESATGEGNAFQSVIGTKEDGYDETATVESIIITGWADIDFDGTIGAILSSAGHPNTVKEIYIGGSDEVSVRVTGRFWDAAGIGGDTGSVIGNITIDNGTVVATGAACAPGIGVGMIAGNFDRPTGSLGNITISDGDVTPSAERKMSIILVVLASVPQ